MGGGLNIFERQDSTRTCMCYGVVGQLVPKQNSIGIAIPCQHVWR